MGVLGGGGPQTAFGFRTHPGDFSCGLAAGVGPDLPRECVDWLDANGIDTEGLALMRVTGTERASPESEEGQSWEGGGADSSAFTCRDAEAETPSGRTFRPTPRAWQITEHDGRRTQVWRTPANAGLYAMLRPPAESLPLKYRAARAFHVGVHPERPDLKLLMDLRNFQKSKKTTERTWISVEPFTRALNPVPRELVERLCSAGDVFSPNELEAVSLVGEGTPLELCERLASAGAKIVCVRRGEKGAVVHDSETRETYSVPTYLQGHDASRIVDVTGCGNAFCGGFIAALVNEESAKRAACWGSAAASVVAEHVGAPATPACASETRKEIEKRFEWLLKRAELLE
jgi:sugar/nucleoside kinase (ribokinase family)